jgi:hypothetical protein
MTENTYTPPTADSISQSLDVVEQSMGELAFLRTAIGALKDMGHAGAVDQALAKAAYQMAQGDLPEPEGALMPMSLDPRPARRLTDREVAKVMGGVVGSFVGVTDAKTLRRAIWFILGNWDTYARLWNIPQLLEAKDRSEHKEGP